MKDNLLKARRQAYANSLSVLEQRLLQRENELQETFASIDRIEGSLKIAKREQGLLAPMVKRKAVAETELIRVAERRQRVRRAIESLTGNGKAAGRSNRGSATSGSGNWPAISARKLSRQKTDALANCPCWRNLARRKHKG